MPGLPRTGTGFFLILACHKRLEARLGVWPGVGLSRLNGAVQVLVWVM